ncbi:NfeD family protein [Paracoccus aminophilus]|uniref:NfeD-like C-terminal domain-containing protein n=1 Tax=Paracoccus aminophilus JCM 7686 TaxID=1367847 RepID=S5XV72_PARAH|nr:hypothetical protein [Paracoccus aminophilus]AGT07245.1 hypothetical protein JCM7686_0134 [Paracoccus aminophilus JCM 7686]
MSALNGWYWLIAALLMALVEVLLPVWLFLGLAIATAVMGLLLLAGLWGGSFGWALVVTGVLSGVIWVLLRRAMGVQHGQVKIWHDDINDNHP